MDGKILHAQAVACHIYDQRFCIPKPAILRDHAHAESSIMALEAIPMSKATATAIVNGNHRRIAMAQEEGEPGALRVGHRVMAQRGDDGGVMGRVVAIDSAGITVVGVDEDAMGEHWHTELEGTWIEARRATPADEAVASLINEALAARQILNLAPDDSLPAAAQRMVELVRECESLQIRFEDNCGTRETYVTLMAWALRKAKAAG